MRTLVIGLTGATLVFSLTRAQATDPVYPGTNMTRDQIAAKLGAAPASPAANIEEGKESFTKLCAVCHIVGDLGASVGPDLSAVGSRFARKDLLEAVLWPSKTISDQYAMITLELNDGTTQSGLIVREDDQFVFLRNAQYATGRGLPVAVANIKNRSESTISLMPEHLVSDLKIEQIDNLLAYMSAQKGN